MNKLLGDHRGVIMYFWKPGDENCNKIGGEYGLMASENDNDDVRFCAINVNTATAVAQHYAVTRVPLFNFFLDRNVERTFQGHDLGALKAFVLEFHRKIPKEDFKIFKPRLRVPISFNGLRNLP